MPALDDIPNLLREAIALHGAGKLHEAEHIYQGILLRDPHNVDALHLLGLSHFQCGRYPQAVAFISRSISVSPQAPILHNNLGLALHALRRSAEAIRSYDAALSLKPDFAEALNTRGISLQDLGRLDEALACHERSLSIRPHFLEAHRNRGLVLMRLNRLDEALAAYDSALSVNSNCAVSHCKRGEVLAALARPDEAIVSYERAIALLPAYAEAHANYGNVLWRLRRLDEALSSYDAALSLAPENAGLYSNKSAVLAELDRLPEAIAASERAIALKRDLPEAHFNRGNALHKAGRFEEAIAAFDIAILLRPDYAEAYGARALSLQRVGRLEEAIAGYHTAIARQPDKPEPYNGLACALTEAGRLGEALAACDMVISLHPDCAEAYCHRGNVLKEQDRLNEAIASYDRALTTKSDLAEAMIGRGVALQRQGRIDEAIDSYNRAIAAAPADAQAYANRSTCYLAIGDFAAGWDDYEWRKRTLEPRGDRCYPVPFWPGAPNIAGKSILIHAEQGLGDTIQFCRYLTLLAQAGARVLFAPQPQLKALMRSLPDDISLVDADDSSLEIDFHSPLLSLPQGFNTTPETIPNTVPYLAAQSERIARMKQQIGDRGFKIGICCQGGPGKIDVGRSFSAMELFVISQLPGVRLISLQKQVERTRSGDQSPGPIVETLGESFDAGADAFLDSAAAIKCCDLVITSDTSVAHLAGALAAPTWVALKFVPDWRWMLHRADSPWYPTMRLFRQTSPGNWHSVFSAMEKALIDRMKRI